MRKIHCLSLILPVLFVFSACKKNVASPEPLRDGPGTISVSIDGNTRSFNYNQDNNSTAKARLGNRYPNLYELVVYGQELPGFFYDDLSITIISRNPIVPGTYSFDSTEIWYCPATIPLQACHVSGSSGIITITEMTSSYVKGTFSATLSYLDNSGVARTNNLTNGKFNGLF
ncbi:MAG: hypothetical protein ABIT05_12435 [Chitinophagaceae bacterium]